MTHQNNSYLPTEYLKNFPDAAPHMFHKKQMNGTDRPEILLKAQDPTHTGCTFPGGYYLAYVIVNPTEAWVGVNDGDDAYMIKPVNNLPEGLIELENLQTLAPFNMEDLKMFGYHRE